MPEYTKFSFYPFGGAPGPNPIHSNAAVTADKHVETEGTSYIIIRHETHVELRRDMGKREPPVILSGFDIMMGELGEPAVSVTRYGPHTSPGEIIYTIHSPFHKTLHIGDADYQWRAVSTGIPGSNTWYELQGLDGNIIAQLFVEKGKIKYNLVSEIEHHSPLCVGIVTAIVYMSLVRDPWLKGSKIDFWAGLYGPN